jgi:PhnB protein
MITVTTYLCAKPAAGAIDFYKRAFDAEEVGERYAEDDGRIGHAEFRIGETHFYISDEAESLGVFSPSTLGGAAVSLSIAVPDADPAYKRAVDAGATAERPLRDETYGRSGWLMDPFGFRWNIVAPAGGSA